MMLLSKEKPVALTIATSDSGAGAGIQADLLTFAGCKVYGITALVALTAQNPKGVRQISELDSEFIKAQLDQLFDYFRIKSIKTGMLLNERIIRTVSDYLCEKREIPLVVDPVMVASSGARLLEPGAIDVLEKELLPKATLITPNLDEAKVMGIEVPERDEKMKEAANDLREKYGTSILLKGGHMEGDSTVVDILATVENIRVFRHPRIRNVNTHGSGCTLSAAITAELAKGQALHNAVKHALEYLDKGMRNPVTLSGESFIAH